MSALSNYLEAALYNHCLKDTAFPKVAQTWAALGTATFGEGPAQPPANEVQAAAWPAYVRQQILIPGGWSAPTDGAGSNLGAVTFPANNGAGNVTITSIGIFDGSNPAASNLLFYADLAQSKTLSPGDVISFAAGAIVVTFQ